MTEKREKPHWEGKHYSFFQNTECEYFPCHKGVAPARFNCLFCYCPLYMLGQDCGGEFRYTEKGIKDCTDCVVPHIPENYGRITGKYAEIIASREQPHPCQTCCPIRRSSGQGAARMCRDMRTRRHSLK